MRARSRRIPAVLWSAILAVVLTLLSGGIWTALLLANLATSPAIPWAPIVMVGLLWLMWQYLGGRWGRQDTAAARRGYLRATPVSRTVFAWALLVGVLGIVALIGSWIVLFQLVKVPGNVLPGFSGYPWLTVALALVAASLVSGLSEEAGFRGYFQGALERAGRGPAAIVITCLLIAPEHALTQGFVWPTMVWYFFVDLLLGGLAYLTQSILPGTVVHVLGLLVFFSLVWPADAHRRLVWDTGADAWFWINVAQAILFTALALLAFRRLAGVIRRERGAKTGGPLPAPAGPPAA